jgi:hypothetical protein
VWVSDHALEVEGNRRLLEYDASLFRQDSTTARFGIPATRVFGTDGSFTGPSCQDALCGPWEPAFSARGHMVVGLNGIIGSRFPLVYDDPLRSDRPDDTLNDFHSMAYAATFDDSDNLYVADLNRDRVFVYRRPFAASPSPPPPVDRYKCYAADPAHAFRQTVTLVDQFGSRTALLRGARLLCNPTEPQSQPLAHLKCYSMRQPNGKQFPSVGRTVVVVNEVVGAQKLMAERPYRLCTPAAMSPPPAVPGEAPNLVDHYECYQAAGSKLDEPFAISDEFSRDDAVLLHGPEAFCTPVDKIVEGLHSRVLQPDVHLACYRLEPKRSFGVPPVNVRDQFGVDLLAVEESEMFCAPSRKFEPTGLLDVSPSSVDFGTLPLGSASSRKITVTNTGSADVILIVEEGHASDLFNVVGQPGTTCVSGMLLAAGASCVQVVEFFEPTDPGAFAGTTQRANLLFTARDPVSGAVLDAAVASLEGDVPARTR